MVYMRERNFNKIKKTVFILLSVFFVVTVITASASACTSKVKDDKCKSSPKEKVVKEKPAKVVDQKAVKEAAQKAAQEKLGTKLLDFVENNWFGNGLGGNCDNGWGGDCNNGWFGDDWDDCWDC